MPQHAHTAQHTHIAAGGSCPRGWWRWTGACDETKRVVRSTTKLKFHAHMYEVRALRVARQNHLPSAALGARSTWGWR